MTTTVYIEQPHYKPSNDTYVWYPNGSYSDLPRLIDSIRPRLANFVSYAPKEVTTLVMSLASFTGSVSDLEYVKEFFGACELIKTQICCTWQLRWSPESRLVKSRTHHQ